MTIIIMKPMIKYRDKEDGISPMMAAVGAGRLEVVRHLVTQHLDENGGDYVRMVRRVKTMMSIGQAIGNSIF